MKPAATHNVESSIRFHHLLDHFCDLGFLGDICDMHGTGAPFRINFADQRVQCLVIHANIVHRYIEAVVGQAQRNSLADAAG